MRRLAGGFVLRCAFAAGVVGALLFGAETAVGALRNSTECQFLPPSFVGACTDQENCQDTCELYWTEGPVEGTCDHNNCCSCVI
jgi:hypothetical protein